MQASRIASQSLAGVSPRCSAPSATHAARRHAGSHRRAKLLVTCATSEAKKIRGLKYDGSNLRWVRDERYGEMDSITVQPKSGMAYTVWPVVHMVLSDKGLKLVTVAEAAVMAEKGWTLVDVRVQDDYDKEHAEGAINIPLYRPVQGNEFWDKVKRLAMAGFAMRATERNPEFISLAQSQLKRNQKIILMCNIGGTLDVLFKPSPHKAAIADADRAFGRESASLKAAYELIEEGGWPVQNVVFVQGGLQQWRHEGQPVVRS